MNLLRLQNIPKHAQEEFFSSYIKADKIMLVLLFIQWMAATFISAVHYDTYLYGFLSGGTLFGLNFLLYKWYNGTRVVRLSIAVSMMLFSLIFIQQHLGRIEIHFHVFIALAILTIYKDIYPVLLASITTIVHHALFNLLQLHNITLFDMPIIVFNYGCGWDIVILHAFFVVIEAIVIMYITKIHMDQNIALIEAEQRIDRENQLNKALARESQEFSNALTESSIVSKTDTRGIITYVNDRFCEVSGYTREELIGQNHSIVRHPDMGSEFFKKMWKTIKSKKVFKALIKNRRKNGDTYYVDTSINPILNVDDEIVEYIAARYDVTELVVARDKAQLAEIAKDNFLANMSHELRTPLNVIIGFTKMAYKKVHNAEVKKFLKTSLDSSDRLLELINTILDTSKIKSGKFTIIAHPFDLEESMGYLFATLKPECDRKNIVCEHSVNTREPVTLNGDWQRISQIIMNLVSNAIKFTPENGHIKIRTSYVGNVLICHVTDSGVGLSKEAQKRIFNAFEQADVSTTREYGGTGLGLSISAELAQMMEGEISVESKEGEGSTFTLTLPLEKLTKEAGESELTKDEDADSEGQLIGKVLVAEDNKTNQMLISLLLGDLGLECDIAENGLDAVKKYEENEYDLVLLDQNMPKMSGIEAMQKIRRSFINVVPIIALTSNAMKGDREVFLKAGMDDFITKPINDKLLYETLAKYLKQS